jgi:hypothetical protein
LGPDIPTIAGGNFQLEFDVQYRHASSGGWVELQDGYAGAGNMAFAARCAGEYQFRVRVRAEQPQGKGSWPNQRYASVWSVPTAITVPGDTTGIVAPLPAGPLRLYLPTLSTLGGC